MANGSKPDRTATPTPQSELRRLNKSLPAPNVILLSNTKSAGRVAMAGNMRTVRTVTISTCRPAKRRRENAYAAKTPIRTDATAVVKDNLKLLYASCENE